MIWVETFVDVKIRAVHGVERRKQVCEEVIGTTAHSSLSALTGMKIEGCQEEMLKGLVLGRDVHVEKVGLEPGDWPQEEAKVILWDSGTDPLGSLKEQKGQGILFCQAPPGLAALGRRVQWTPFGVSAHGPAEFLSQEIVPSLIPQWSPATMLVLHCVLPWLC